MVHLSGFDLSEAACFLRYPQPDMTQQGAAAKLIINSHFLVWLSSEKALIVVSLFKSV